MVTPDILYYGLRHDGLSNIDTLMFHCINGDNLLSIMQRRLQVVVEIIHELCICWILSLFIFTLVPCDKDGFGWHFAADGISLLYGFDLFHICIVLWRGWVDIIVLVYSQDLWVCKG